MADPSHTMDETAKRLGMTRSPLRNRFIRLSLPIKTQSSYRGLKVGKNSKNWKGGRTRTTEGYIWLKLDENDPYVCMTDPQRRYILEHRYVMAQYLGRALYTWETVHHNDGDKENNTISNLQLRIGRHGKGQSYKCMDCGSHRLEPTPLNE